MFNPNSNSKKTSGPESDSYLDSFSPLEVKVTGKFDEALHKFRAIVTKERIMSSLKEHESYEKPSERKRRKIREGKQRTRKLQLNMEKMQKEHEKEQRKASKARRRSEKEVPNE